MSKYSSVVMDRIAGALVGTACGDALGAGYEFGPALEPEVPVSMTGEGPFGFEPGEWTDDTSMAIAIAELAAGADLRMASTQDQLVRRWIDWTRVSKDVGVQTASVLSSASKQGTALAATEAARQHHERTGRSAGNGSLMRTAPVALAFLDDAAALARVARSVGSLTHFDEDAGDACVLWCLAIRHAVLHGEFDVRIGLDSLASDRQRIWSERIQEAEQLRPRDFTNNGWVVQAFQGAWSAIHNTPVPVNNAAKHTYEAQHLQLALEATVRGGNDTDTVAAIAGGLLGARWGVSAVPVEWQRKLHGWPDLRQRDLVRLAIAVADPALEERSLDYDYLRQYSTTTIHPHDSGVILGSVNGLVGASADIDAVVSLCRMDARYRPAGVDDENLIEIWLTDSDDPDDNAHCHFVLSQAAEAVTQLRREGHTVYLHCAAGQSRTPAVAALVGASVKGIKPAMALVEVAAALPDARVNPLFVRLLDELAQ